MAWGRVCELSVGSDGQGLLVSGLDIDFEIEKSLSFSDNTAQFTIYNAKEETRKEILKAGNNIIFRVGYEDETVGVIFSGNITETSTIKTRTDWETKITAQSARGLDGALRSEYVSLTFSAGTNLSRIISQLANLYGLVVYGIENASVILPNGWQYVGKISGAFRYIDGILKSHRKGMFKDDKEIIIFNQGESSKLSVVKLTYEGGLKSLEDITDSDSSSKTKYKFSSLIMPQCQVNGLVNIITPKVKGVFTVEKLKFIGNNYGGGFDMEGEVFL